METDLANRLSNLSAYSAQKPTESFFQIPLMPCLMKIPRLVLKGSNMDHFLSGRDPTNYINK